jgi:hypothetical protein
MYSEISPILQKFLENQRDVHSIKEISWWTGLTVDERAILTAIRHHMRERTSLKGSKGWSVRRDEDLVKECGLSKSTVRRVIAGLKKKQVLEVGKGKKNGPSNANSYAIHKQTCCYSR